jgi:hypothetical protein
MRFRLLARAEVAARRRIEESNTVVRAMNAIRTE